MKKLLLLLFLLSGILSAQGITYHNQCRVNTGPVSSQCAVSVFNAGTVTPSSIYSNEALTTPLANPFTATTSGRFTFYAAAADYDIQMAGGTPALPTTTLFDVSLGGSGGGGGSGTVTSVAFLPASNHFNVSGSPITSAGTILMNWNTQVNNRVLAGPETSGSAIPTFRDLVDADIPNTITVSLAAAATALAANPTDCGSNVFATAIDASGNLTCSAIVDAAVPDNITITLAATATALAGNPSDCGGGQFANAIDASGNLTCATPSTVGTVTSVGLSAPASILSVAGSPVTSSGTLALSLTTQTANTGWFGPTTGSAATPTFRTLVDADVPDSITISLANTATAFASNPSDCSVGQFANAIDTQGNLTCSATAGSGDVLGPVTHADNLVPQWNGVDTKTLKAGLVASQTATVSALAQRDGSGNLAGNVLGNAATATALAANGSNCSANQFNKGVNVSGAAEDCAALIDGDIPAAIARDAELPVPGGSTTQLQYNNAGAFGGLSTLTTDGTNLALAATAYFDIAQRAAPANPGAGTRRIFVDSSNGQLSTRTSAGTTVSLEAGGAGTPGGSSTNLQFNEGGSFGGDDELIWNTTTKLLTVSSSVDGAYNPVVLRNSQANAGSSINETVDLQFGFASASDNARIRLGKMGDYTTGADENSQLSFWVDIQGTLTNVLSLQQTGAVATMTINALPTINTGTGIVNIIGSSIFQVYGEDVTTPITWQTSRTRTASAALQDNDEVFEGLWDGFDDVPEQTTFASLLVTARDVTDTTEDGELTMSVMAAGTLSQRLLMDVAGVSLTERLALTKTDNNTDPLIFRTVRNRAGGPTIANDEIFQRWHYGFNSSSVELPFFREQVKVTDNGSGTESAEYYISTRVSGGLNVQLGIAGNIVTVTNQLNVGGEQVALQNVEALGGACISGGGTLAADFTFDLDLTECGSLTRSNGASASYQDTFAVTGTDPVITYSNDLIAISSVVSAKEFQSGDGLTAGRVFFRELAANGTNERAWLAQDSYTATVWFRPADASPADSLMIFGTPSANISEATWLGTTGTGVVMRVGSPTNVVIDVEGSGNAFSTYSFHAFDFVGCAGTSGTVLWDTLATLAPTATCSAGSTETTMMRGTLDFPDSDGDYSVQRSFGLPPGTFGTMDVKFVWKAAATSGNIVWQIQTACRADAEVDDVAWNTASTVTDAAKGTTLQLNEASITGVTVTGCAAGETEHVRILRNRTHASDSITGVVSLANGGGMTFRETK